MTRTQAPITLNQSQISPHQCPRCHTTKKLQVIEFQLNHRTIEVAIRCECGFTGLRGTSLDQAILAFNRLAREVAIT